MTTPLIFFPGWAMPSLVFQPWQQEYLAQFQCLNREWPGLAGTPLPARYGLDRITDHYAATLPQQAILIGWSLGGLLALSLAEKLHARGVVLLTSSAKLIAGDAWPGITPSALATFQQQLQENPQKKLSEFLALQINTHQEARRTLPRLKTALKALPAPMPAALHQGLKILEESDLRKQLIDCTSPILQILGERDSIIPVKMAKAMQQLKPNIRTEILPQAAHAPFLSHKALLSEKMMPFIHNCLQ